MKGFLIKKNNNLYTTMSDELYDEFILETKTNTYNKITSLFQDSNSDLSKKIQENFPNHHQNLKKLILQMIEIYPQKRCDIEYVQEMINKTDEEIKIELQNNTKIKKSDHNHTTIECSKCLDYNLYNKIQKK